MRLKIFVILFIFNLTNTFNVLTQHLFDNLQLSVGYAIQPQDRRLFDYPHRLEIIKMEQTKYDHQFEALFNKDVYTKGNLILNAGLGYSVFTTNFSRPFDHNYFTGDITRELRHIKAYSIHSIKCGSTLKLRLLKADNSSFSLILPIGCHFAINKRASDSHGNWKENRWKLEFSKLETYTGIEYTIDRFKAGLSYRIFNLQEIDPVIFFRPLFDSSTYPFLLKKTENINLTKAMLLVTYQL